MVAQQDLYIRMVKQNKERKRISPNVIAILGAIFTLIGGFFLSYNYIETKKVVAYDYMANIFYQEDSNQEDNNQATTKETNINENIEEVEKQNQQVIYNYIGYLEIPKINLKKGFVDINSPDNDVEKNIFIAETSTYPDVEKGNFIIAGHSGTGWNAFFNDLYKLTSGDKINVRYNGKVYTYKIVNIYEQEKTGTVSIYRNYNKTVLTLVTCTNNNKKTQTIYVSELESIKNE